MPWVSFTENFIFRPPENNQVSVKYKANTVHFVRQVCAAAAIKKGKAVAAKKPSDAPDRGDLDRIESQVDTAWSMTGVRKKKRKD